jgi:hypothetical protein
MIIFPSTVGVTAVTFSEDVSNVDLAASSCNADSCNADCNGAKVAET